MCFENMKLDYLCNTKVLYSNVWQQPSNDCLQLYNVSSFYSSHIHPQTKYEFHICCEWKDAVNAGKRIENCLENVNHYLAIYLLL